jgi:hypothetical protein
VDAGVGARPKSLGVVAAAAAARGWSGGGGERLGVVALGCPRTPSLQNVLPRKFDQVSYKNYIIRSLDILYSNNNFFITPSKLIT